MCLCALRFVVARVCFNDRKANEVEKKELSVVGLFYGRLLGNNTRLGDGYDDCKVVWGSVHIWVSEDKHSVT